MAVEVCLLPDYFLNDLYSRSMLFCAGDLALECSGPSCFLAVRWVPILMIPSVLLHTQATMLGIGMWGGGGESAGLELEPGPDRLSLITITHDGLGV